MMTELLLIFFLFQIHQNERIHIIVFSSITGYGGMGKKAFCKWQNVLLNGTTAASPPAKGKEVKKIKIIED